MVKRCPICGKRLSKTISQSIYCSKCRKMRAYRKIAFLNKGCICEKCGTVLNPRKLTVHHILPQSLYPKLRKDKDNLAVLCRDCHTEFHLKYDLDSGVKVFKTWIKENKS